MTQPFLNDIAIGHQWVGPTHTPLILPDIDMFFNGDLDVADALIACVKAAGLTTIKAAILEDPDIVFDNGAEESYLGEDGQTHKTNYRALIHKKILTRAQHIALFDKVRAHGLQLVVSVYDVASVAFAKEQGVVALKIPSSNITHRILIEASATSGLPLIIDTGKATMPEITRAVDWAKLAGADGKIIVEHSPFAPPAPMARQDLSMIPYLRDALGCHAGLSHHARGPLMMLASVPLGATLIECGLCQDDEASDQDVFHALRASDLAPTVKQIADIHAALGTPFDQGRHAITYHQARMGLRAAVDLAPGDVLDLDNTSFSFPPLGIGAEDWYEHAGKAVITSIKAGQPIYRHDIA